MNSKVVVKSIKSEVSQVMTDCVCPELCHQSSQAIVWTNYFPPSHLSTEYFVNLSTHLQNRSIVLMFCFNSDDKLTKPTLYLYFVVSLIKLIFYHCISDKSIVFNHGRRDLTGKKRTLLCLPVKRNPVKEGSGFVDWWVSVCPSYIDNPAADLISTPNYVKTSRKD